MRTRLFSTGEYATSWVEKKPVFDFSYPVRGDDGKVTGVLIATQNLTNYLDFLKNILLPPGSRVAISDRNGVILMDRSWQIEPTRAGQRIIPENWLRISNWQQDDGSFFAKRYDGVLAYIHFKNLRLNPGEQPFMVVNTNTPRNTLLAKADSALWTNLALLTLAVALALAIARGLGQVMVGRYIAALGKSEQEFRLLAEAMPQIVWTCSADGANSYFNQQWMDYTGMTLEESLGDGWIEPFHPDDKKTAWDAWQHATRHNAAYALEGRIRRADGTYHWWLIRGVPAYDDHGVITQWLGTCTDIDDLKQTQAMLVQAKDEANVANKAKSEFLANMSHEIRTPLNGVIGMLQLLETTEQTEEQKEYVGAAIRSSLRLTNLLADILDLSRIEAGRLPIHETAFEIHNLVEAVQVLFDLAAKEKGLSIQYAFDDRLPEVLVGDEIRVRQILFNLVGNAIKFTQTGSVRIEAVALSDLPPGFFWVLFIVSDTGEGIADDQLGRVFEPFVQGDGSYVRRFQGAGLGLAIVERLVAMLGGGLTIESEVGQGTTVYVSIPFKVPAAQIEHPAAALQGAPQTRHEGRRILFAEDDSVTRLTVQRLLEKAGFQVRVVEDGQKALEALAADSFDLILMDIQMPNMDGLQVTKALRSQETFKSARDIPIIAVTAYAMAGDREKFLNAGMNGYISKPVDISELIALIAQVAPL